MMTIKQLLTELESQVPDKAVGTAAAKLGKVAFGDQRGLGEKNTEHEDELLKVVSDFIIHNKQMPDWAVQELSGYLTRGFYKPTFKRPTVSQIYRGMAVTADWLKSKVKADVSHDGSVDTRFTFIPIRPASSWSVSESIADLFSHASSNSALTHRVVLIADVADNSTTSMLEVAELYKIIKTTTSAEREVIVFGPVKVKSVSWVTKN